MSSLSRLFAVAVIAVDVAQVFFREKSKSESLGRFFLCARCRAQALIGRCRDRGQVYCSDGCADDARRQNQREAGQRYQTSYLGRAAHVLGPAAIALRKRP